MKTIKTTPEAPYGLKKDGTPMQKRGRKPKHFYNQTIAATSQNNNIISPSPMPKMEEEEVIVDTVIEGEVKKNDTHFETKSSVIAPHGFKKDGTPAKKRGRKSKRETMETLISSSEKEAERTARLDEAIAIIQEATESVAARTKEENKEDPRFIQFCIGNKVMNSFNPEEGIGRITSCKTESDYVNVDWGKGVKYWIGKKSLTFIADK